MRTQLHAQVGCADTDGKVESRRVQKEEKSADEDVYFRGVFHAQIYMGCPKIRR